MGLNKQKGNMYPWVTHTWNVVKGKCPHDCSYCYMKLYPQKPIRFDMGELKTGLGEGNTIFVGSSCDAWANDIPATWIKSMLFQCSQFPDNKYLFQSKNPARFAEFIGEFPPEFMLGCTIETNRLYPTISKAPTTFYRKEAMANIPFLKMISIEPILDFDLDDLVRWIKQIAPEFVSIGADSQNHHLPEPPASKVKALIEALQGITTVKIKDNLKRLLPNGEGE